MRYAMFLRGINVGGVKVPMADLRGLLTTGGLQDVTTYLHTGNVTFRCRRWTAALHRRTAQAIGERFTYEAHLLVLEDAQLREIVDSWPFAPDDTHHRYAVLCDSPALVEQLASTVPGDNEQLAAGPGASYWRCPKGASLDTVFAKVLAARKLKEHTTTRNLNTLAKMVGTRS